ncbi:MAG: helix-turn-helix domain-containing protein, partial [Micromonosporaceae bacterium]
GYATATVARLTGPPRPAADVLGAEDRPTAAAILADGEDAALVRALEDWLERLDPRPDPTARQVTALVAEAEARPEIVRAEQLARHAAVSLRTLQRLFTEYLGIGPKWVIQRFRILDATAAAHRGEVDWAGLAHQLGFSDQAHLTRVFTQVVGTPPATYQRDPGT